MQVWIVGKVDRTDHRRWEFQGVYDDRQEAIDICEDETWFVAPAWMNEYIATETVSWPGAFYPKAPMA